MLDSERKRIKVGQLLAILNQRILRNADTSKCRILAITPQMNPPEGQCNWSSSVSWNANGQDRDRAMPIIRRLVMNAQKEYDILPMGGQ